MSKSLQKREPYRPLTVPEKDLLFAMYDKHNGNVLGMIRDRECPFKSRNQVYYYRDLYYFKEHLVQIRANRAKKVLDSLKDSKILVLEQASRMVETRQIPLKNKQGELLLDFDNQPIFHSVEPDHKEIKTAWEIIKTELGEPTTIGKYDHTTKGEKINSHIVLSDKEVIDHESQFKRKYIKPEAPDSAATGDNGGAANNETGTEGGPYDPR
jgi:hypothetical protein